MRISVPFPPGGAADALPRILAEKLSAKWNQPFVVENRAGATGAIAGELLSRAEPDGYTFMSTPPAPLVINPSLFTKLAYARANPGRLNYASQGTTSVSFLTTEMFLAIAGGLKIQHVPYKGTGRAGSKRSQCAARSAIPRCPTFRQ